MNKSEKIRILIVDDHPILRLGVAAIIEVLGYGHWCAQVRCVIQRTYLRNRKSHDINLIAS